MTANPVAIALALVLHERRPADDRRLVGGDLLKLEVEVEVLLALPLLILLHVGRPAAAEDRRLDLLKLDGADLPEALLEPLLLLADAPPAVDCLLAVAPGPGRAVGHLVVRVVAILEIIRTPPPTRLFGQFVN